MHNFLKKEKNTSKKRQNNNVQKKNDDILEYKLLVIITFNAIKDPKRYAPPSPRKIFAVGKLNNKKESKIIICPISINENSKFEFSKFIYVNTELIMIKWIVNIPLNPSIKFAPFIINKKHKSTKIDDRK